MTAKQRAARAKFKAVVAEAKKLRKKNPKLTQAQAVKQAFAISYGKKRAGVGAVKKKAVPKKKAAPTKVKAKKSKKTSQMHTDTKSHNVNIRVLSGMDKMKLNLNMHHVQELRHLTNSLSIAQYNLKKAMDQRKASRDKDAKKYFNNLAIRFRDEIQGIKKQIFIVKKFIK